MAAPETTSFDPRSTMLLRIAQSRRPDSFPAVMNRAVAAPKDFASVSAALLDAALVTSLEIAEATAAVVGLRAVDVNAGTLDASVVGLIPLALCKRHRVLAVALGEQRLIVAMVDPGNIVAADDVRTAAGREIEIVVAPGEDIDRALDWYERELTQLGEDRAETPARPAPAVVDGEEPVVKFLSSLLERAIGAGASDIHIEPMQRQVRIRFRIDGVLHETDAVPVSRASALVSRIKVLSDLDIAERRVPQNGRLTVRHEDRPVDLRVATMPTVWGEKVVLRILDSDRVELDLGKLNFSERNHRELAAALEKPHGMVLVTGPTGSGKSTTLYAAVQHLLRPQLNIITVEDPVEYRLDGVNQVQINTKAGMTFPAVLPAILRSDPDIVLVGEIRDEQTAQLAVEAALTGHLLLSTLHTNDAPSAAARLIDMGIEPFLLGASLEAVMAQRLTRRLCEWCREAYEPSEEELGAMRWPVSLPRPSRLWRAVGCRNCHQIGYRGRLAFHEVMIVGEAIEALIVRGAPAHEIRAAAVDGGMISLAEDGFVKAAMGLTTPAEVLRVAR